MKQGETPKTAYRTVSRKYHPDLLRGAFPTMTDAELEATTKLANEIMAQVNAEYRFYDNKPRAQAR